MPGQVSTAEDKKVSLGQSVLEDHDHRASLESVRTACPFCGYLIQAGRKRGLLNRGETRNRIMMHIARRHPGTALRDSSLLADRATAGLETEWSVGVVPVFRKGRRWRLPS